jgi:hypothetical protein
MTIPFIMQAMAARVQKRERLQDLQEICDAVDGIVRLYEEAKALLTFDPLMMPALERCARLSSDATDAKHALSIMRGQPGLTDGSVAASTSAIRAADAVGRALCGPYHGDYGWDKRRLALAMGELPKASAAERIERVRRHHGLAEPWKW